MTRPLFLILIGLMAARAPAQMSVALVTGLTDKPTLDLLSVASARIASDKTLRLVERAAIDKLLAEQKLSLTGLIDADQAVKLGGIIAADLLAVVEGDPQPS